MSGSENKNALQEGMYSMLFGSQFPEALTREYLQELNISYREIYIQKTSFTHKLPIAITPEAAFPRLRAQRGRFTVHGSDRRALEENCSQAVRKITVKNSAIDDIQEHILELGIDAVSIFPDAIGLADFLKRRYSLSSLTRTKTLASKLRESWHSDREILESRSIGNIEPVKSTFNIGIENCVLSYNYIMRVDSSKYEDDLKDWLLNSEKGGIRVVTGKAGSGKTNFLVSLVFNNDLYQRRNVIWFPLFRFDPKQGLLRSLRSYLQNRPYMSNADLTLALSELLRRSDTILILDGLDELSRLQGQQVAFDLITVLQEELGSEYDTKVIISCRYGIFARLRASINLDKVLSFNLPELDKESIERELNHRNIKATDDIVKVIQEYPIFLRFLDPVLLTKQAPLNSNQIFLNLIPESNSTKEYNLLFLGKIAQAMLDRRQDFLSFSDFQEFQNHAQLFFSNPAFLLYDKNENIRFIHHNVREFILAWNVQYALTSSNRDVWNLLSKSTNLDYVGAEIYKAVSELGGIKDWDQIKKYWEIISKKWEDGNNFAWGSFEAAGILGIPLPEQRNTVLNWIYEVINRPVDGQDNLISFQAKYNAVRCLERLHPSAPQPYWEWIVKLFGETCELQPTEKKQWIYGHALRGFQRRRPGIGTVPQLEVHRDTSDSQQEDFSALLLQKIKELGCFRKLADSACYLMINLSHALIRWYSKDHQDQVLRILENPFINPHTKANLQLILWFWHEMKPDEKLINKKLSGENRFSLSSSRFGYKCLN